MYSEIIDLLRKLHAAGYLTDEIEFFFYAATGGKRLENLTLQELGKATANLKEQVQLAELCLALGSQAGTKCS